MVREFRRMSVLVALFLGCATTGHIGLAAPGDPPAPSRPDPCAAVVAGDFDRDTLSNYRECQLGTNPYDTDSDDDGLSDPSEVAKGTNPLNSNTDRDSLPDSCEVFLVLNFSFAIDPTVYDTDTDSDIIPNVIETWGGTNPTSNDTDQDILFDGEEWFVCSNSQHFDVWIANALDPDRDGDDIPDGIEVKSTGTDPDLLDTDGDGWSDYTEVYDYGTDPLDPSDKPSGYPPDHP